MCRSYTNKFKYGLKDKNDIIEVTDIFNSEVHMESTSPECPDVNSYKLIAPAWFWPRSQKPEEASIETPAYKRRNGILVVFFCSMGIDPDLRKLGTYGDPGQYTPIAVWPTWRF